MNTGHVAPATRILTVVHLRDDHANPPATRCGQPMAEHELWLPVSPAVCDTICRQCQTGTIPEQDTLL